MQFAMRLQRHDLILLVSSLTDHVVVIHHLAMNWSCLPSMW